MCDYSLSVTESRSAEVGERLIVHRFLNGVKGFVPDPDLCSIPASETGRWSRILEWFSYKKDPCAVCLRPGAKLILRDLPAALRSELNLQQDEEVTLTIGGSSGFYRDSVKFEQGPEILVQWLPAGLTADVLSISSAPRTRTRHEYERETDSSLSPEPIPVRSR